MTDNIRAAVELQRERDEARTALRATYRVLRDLMESGVLDIDEIRANEDEVRGEDGSWPEGWDEPFSDAITSALTLAGDVLGVIDSRIVK